MWFGLLPSIKCLNRYRYFVMMQNGRSGLEETINFCLSFCRRWYCFRREKGEMRWTSWQEREPSYCPLFFLRLLFSLSSTLLLLISPSHFFSVSPPRSSQKKLTSSMLCPTTHWDIVLPGCEPKVPSTETFTVTVWFVSDIYLQRNSEGSPLWSWLRKKEAPLA